MPKKKSQKIDKLRNHPHHHHSDGSMLDLVVPLATVLGFFLFYNKGIVTGPEMVKTTGLAAILLLSLTLIVSPLARLLPFFASFKKNRKAWGIASFIFTAAHLILVFIFYYKGNLGKFVDFANPKYSGIATGIISTLILFFVSLTSSEAAILKLSPRTWKIIQYTSVIALVLALYHFYVMETKAGVLVISRIFGRVTFGFAGFALLLRFIVLFIPKKK